MAGITDLQYKLMELQSKGYPEFDAGLYPYQQLQLKDFFSPPQGPLYNIDPTLVPEGENYYSEDYDSDIDKTSYSQWTGVDDPSQRLNVELLPEDSYPHGSSYGALQAIKPELMRDYGTFPTSPRNEMSPIPDWYHGPTTDLGMTDTVENGTTISSRNEAVNQANINRYITDVLSHEVSHGLDHERGFRPIADEAQNIEVGYGPHKLSEHEMRELYTRARDLKRANIMNPDREEESDTDILFYPPSDEGGIAQRFIFNKLGSFDAMNNYLNQVKPLVNRYFDQVGKHRKYKKSYESGRAPGHWYHGLDYKGGAAGHVSQAGPGRQEDPQGGAFLKASPSGRRPDKPGGFTDPGKGSYGPHKAHGGLIDVPLPGRSRDI